MHFHLCTQTEPTLYFLSKCKKDVQRRIEILETKLSNIFNYPVGQINYNVEMGILAAYSIVSKIRTRFNFQCNLLKFSNCFFSVGFGAQEFNFLFVHLKPKRINFDTKVFNCGLHYWHFVIPSFLSGRAKPLWIFWPTWNKWKNSLAKHFSFWVPALNMSLSFTLQQ